MMSYDDQQLEERVASFILFLLLIILLLPRRIIIIVSIIHKIGFRLDTVTHLELKVSIMNCSTNLQQNYTATESKRSNVGPSSRNERIEA